MQLKSKQAVYQVKQSVQKKYVLIAEQGKAENKKMSNQKAMVNTITIPWLMPEEYTSLSSYLQETDLGLSCRISTQYANIKSGNVVIYLGSVAESDCFIARSITRESGRVVGPDFTQEMIKRQNPMQKMNFSNADFIFEYVERILLKNRIADVIISNYRLNF